MINWLINIIKIVVKRQHKVIELESDKEPLVIQDFLRI